MPDSDVINISRYLDLSASLLGRFTEVVKAFNAQNLGAVAGFFDSNIILTTLTPPTIRTGINQVTNYLQVKLGETPPPLFQPEVTQVNAGTGRVSGQGLWSDQDTPHAHIRYEFTFVLHNDDDQWYVVALWGTPA
jgi:hypothetical protein